MSYFNPNTPIYPSTEQLEADIATLNLTVAYSSITEPAPNTIALWADQGTGVYPLTTNRGATTSSGITVDDNDNMSFVGSVGFNPAVSNPGDNTTIWSNYSDSNKLYFGNNVLGAGGPFMLNGCTNIDGTNQNLISGNYLTPIFDVNNHYCDIIPKNAVLDTFRWKISRALTSGESINVRLIVNGNPVITLGSFTSTTPLTGGTTFIRNLNANDEIYILINSFSASSTFVMCWSLSGSFS